jgi:hypothetical protein
MPDLTPYQWTLALLAAAGIGIAKSGLAGVSLVHVLVFAFLFGARDSTGVVLPMLIAGDIFAVAAFRQHARWDAIRKMLPPACAGILAGWALMESIDDAQFQPLIGWIILCLSAIQAARMRWPGFFQHLPHSTAFMWGMGMLAGITTMLANAAGPVMALYFLAVALPKMEFVGTSAWFFLIVNLIKVPFSAQLGLIRPDSLALNALLVPAIGLGLLAGRILVRRISQRWFEGLLLAFAACAALRLIGIF